MLYSNADDNRIKIHYFIYMEKVYHLGMLFLFILHFGVIVMIKIITYTN